MEGNRLQVETVQCVVPVGTDVVSLVGRVLAAGPLAEGMTVGNRIVALAPRSEATVTLPSTECAKVGEEKTAGGTEAYWALASALLPLVRRCEIEIGDTVLVLSAGLVGQMLADLAWVAGAGACMALDTSCTDGEAGHCGCDVPHGARFATTPEALADNGLTSDVDVLVDASGDPGRLKAHLGRVRVGGRVVAVSEYSPSRFDLNVYPELHRRSLRFVICQRRPSLSDPESRDITLDLGTVQSLDVVRHLFESRRLCPSRWPVTRLGKADMAADRGRTAFRRGPLLVQWSD